MRKEMIIAVLFVSVLLISLGVQAEEQTSGQAEQIQYRTYSGWGRFVDNVKMFFSGGDNKVRLSLEIREKEVYSAISNVQNEKEGKAVKNLERATKRLRYIQEKVSLDTSEEIKISVDEITEKINAEEDLPDEFDDYLLEEEKTQLTAVLTEKTFEYCTELAKEDFASMLGDEECNPETAMPGLEKDLKKLKVVQEESFILLMLEIRSCIDDPGTCNCEASLDDDERAKCEKMVVLAIKCEYREDETSCDELEAMMPSPGDGFARSFIPDYLMSSFDDRRDLIEYGLEHSDEVPEECWDENDKPECEKYERLKEDVLDWDEQGNWIGWKRGKIRATGGTMETSVPTIQESIPECFDENDNFLEEKCGKITIVWNEEGLINYLIGNQIDDIIDDFENKSRQYAPGTSANGTTVNGNETWTIDTDEVREIKKEMNQIIDRIVDITYAPGTGPGGDGGNVIDGDGQDVVTDDGNGGYAPGTSAGGDGGDTIDAGDVVVTDGSSGTVDSGTVDNSGDDVVDDTVSDGSGEPGMIDED